MFANVQEEQEDEGIIKHLWQLKIQNIIKTLKSAFFVVFFFLWKRSIKQQRRKKKKWLLLNDTTWKITYKYSKKIAIKVYEIIASIRLGTNLELQMVKGE